MNITTIDLSLITGMMLGFEYVDPEASGAHTLVIDVLFVRILIQHGPLEE